MNGFSRRPPVRRVAAVVALVAAAGVVGAGPASAAPRTAGAGAFHDSVGLVANDTYFDTPYVHWSTALDKARELGVRHLRLGVFSSDDAGWDARHAADLQDAAAAGFGLELIVSRDCASDGTMPRCLARARSLPAGSVEGLEWPHEYDNRGDGNWVAHLSAWGHELAFRARGDARLAGVPIIGPSLRFVGSPLALGDQSAALDRVEPPPVHRRPEPHAGPRARGGRAPAPGHRRQAGRRHGRRLPHRAGRAGPGAARRRRAHGGRLHAADRARALHGRGPAHVPPRARRRGERPQRRARELRPHAHGLLARSRPTPPCSACSRSRPRGARRWSASSTTP